MAITRGPLVYAAEEADHGADLSALVIPRHAACTVLPFDATLLSGVRVIEVLGKRRVSTDHLYSQEPLQEEEVTIRLVPYYAWGNRAPGEMRVWLHESNE